MRRIFKAIKRRVVATFRTIALSLKTLKDVWFKTRTQARADIELAFANVQSKNDAEVILDSFLSDAMNAFTKSLTETFGLLIADETHDPRTPSEHEEGQASDNRSDIPGFSPFTPPPDPMF